jgi:hypothetical protein
MPMKRLTPPAKARTYLDKRLALWKKAIINNLVMVGESVLRHARTHHKYKDQTGNLTSSIGYCILDNGRVVLQSTFEVAKGGGLGSSEGRKFLRGLVAKNSKGIVFIMVAGMPYSQYVEAMSLDVLDSAEQLAKRMIPEIMKALKF